MPEEQTVTAPEPAAATETEKPPEPSADEPFLAVDYNGQQVPLTQEQTMLLTQAGLEYFGSQRQEAEQAAAKPEPSRVNEDTPVDDDPTAKLSKKTESLEQTVAEMKAAQEKRDRDAEVKEQAAVMQRDIDKEKTKHDLTKGDEAAAELARDWTLTVLWHNPQASAATVYPKIVKKMADFLNRHQKQFVESKIEQSKVRGEAAGGAAPGGQTKRLTGADLDSGGVKRAAIARLRAARGA